MTCKPTVCKATIMPLHLLRYEVSPTPRASAEKQQSLRASAEKQQSLQKISDPGDATGVNQPVVLTVPKGKRGASKKIYSHVVTKAEPAIGNQS
jgi:hypothetical protein